MTPHFLKDVATGHLLKNQNSNHLANGCPSSDPCVDCSGVQPSVTITTDAGGACAIDGVYTWNSFVHNVPGQTCTYLWDGPVAGQFLRLMYFEVPGTWNSVIDDGGNFNIYQDNPQAGITCVAGKLTFNTTVPGALGCVLQTATIVNG